MKAASLALINYLANLSQNEPDAQVFLEDLYTFILVDGTVIRWCSGAGPITLQQGPITSAQLSAGGQGSRAGDTYFLAGSSNDAMITVVAVDSIGAATQITVTTAGTNYQVWAGVGVYPGGPQPGSGSGIMLSITAVSGKVTYNVLSPAFPDLPAISRSKVNSTIGLSVDDLTIQISATPIVQIDGNTLLSAFCLGLFDGARVIVSRIVMPKYGDVSLGTVIWFSGTVGDIREITTVGAKIIVKAMTELLNIQMPRNLYQPACRQTLFDAGCTLRAANFTVAGAVAGSNNTVIQFSTNLSQPGPIAGPVGGVGLSLISKTSVNLNSTSYYVVVTYVTALGETTHSPEVGFFNVPASSVSNNLWQGHLLVVNSPPAAAGVLGYNVYVGQSSGQWQKQNGAPIAIGSQWIEDPRGLLQGVPPPTNTTGYFTQGIIFFTGGANLGLSRFIISYTNPGGNAGIINLIDALPVTPAAGDTFMVRPGCDKAPSTCLNKFSNLSHFGGQPFIPQPETSF